MSPVSLVPVPLLPVVPLVPVPVLPVVSLVPLLVPAVPVVPLLPVVPLVPVPVLVPVVPSSSSWTQVHDRDPVPVFLDPVCVCERLLRGVPVPVPVLDLVPVLVPVRVFVRGVESSSSSSVHSHSSSTYGHSHWQVSSLNVWNSVQSSGVRRHSHSHEVSSSTCNSLHWREEGQMQSHVISSWISLLPQRLVGQPHSQSTGFLSCSPSHGGREAGQPQMQVASSSRLSGHDIIGMH